MSTTGFVAGQTIANMLTQIDTFLTSTLPVAQRWSKSGSTYTSPTVNGRTLSFTLSSTGTSLIFTLPGSPTKILYLHTGSTDAASTSHSLMIYGSDRHFLVVGQGPSGSGVGAGYAPNGSLRQCFGLFPYTAYHSSDSTLSDHIVAIGNPTAANTTKSVADVFVKRDVSGASWTSARLTTLKPCLSDRPNESGLGRNLRVASAFNQVTALPYVIVETVGGLRGRIEGLVHLYEPLGTADSYLAYFSGNDLYIEGNLHRVTTLWGAGGDSAAYGPNGSTFYTGNLPDQELIANCGPCVAVRY